MAERVKAEKKKTEEVEGRRYAAVIGYELMIGNTIEGEETDEEKDLEERIALSDKIRINNNLIEQSHEIGLNPPFCFFWDTRYMHLRIADMIWFEG